MEVKSSAVASRRAIVYLYAASERPWTQEGEKGNNVNMMLRYRRRLLLNSWFNAVVTRMQAKRRSVDSIFSKSYAG